jgi:hypothetical protein
MRTLRKPVQTTVLRLTDGHQETYCQALNNKLAFTPPKPKPLESA